MKLYLVQHGKSANKAVDPSRGLTAEGVGEVESVGRSLEAQGLCMPEVWHSGKLRARQTAELIVVGLVDGGTVMEKAGLSPNEDVRAVVESLAGRDTDLMIVGHLPFLSRLASLLLVDDSEADIIVFRNAGVVCLARDVGSVWRVAWLVVPNIG